MATIFETHPEMCEVAIVCPDGTTSAYREFFMSAALRTYSAFDGPDGWPSEEWCVARGVCAHTEVGHYETLDSCAQYLATSPRVAGAR